VTWLTSISPGSPYLRFLTITIGMSQIMDRPVPMGIPMASTVTILSTSISAMRTIWPVTSRISSGLTSGTPSVMGWMK